MRTFMAALIGAAAIIVRAAPVAGQEPAAPMAEHVHTEHPMWSAELGGGWRLLGMAQAYPVVTIGAPGEEGSPLNRTELYLTQPAAMANLESPGSRWALRSTLNLEGVTLEDGELTFGGWGEGFIDKRHPHTLLHELMVSLNFWGVLGGNASISAGKGFAPYGTDDPMSRPGLKYPTNHHLSQILERWTLNGAFLRDGWSVEAGLFGGSEPEGPYDFGNIDSFGNSVSARVAKRWGPGEGTDAAWEASASVGRVVEEHDGEDESTRLWNVALRHELAHSFGELYGLAELSRSDPEHDRGYFSALGETQLGIGRHRPYVRVEYATRPEYPRAGVSGTDGFFRYDHDAEAIGATRWTIASLGYGFTASVGTLSVRPFAEVQANRVERERGPGTLEPELLFGSDTFWALSIGARVFLGGDPMRMGAYGVLDPMTAMNRMMATMMPGMPMDHPHAPDR